MDGYRICKSKWNLRKGAYDILPHHWLAGLRICLIRIYALFPDMGFQLYFLAVIKLDFNNRRIPRCKTGHNPYVTVNTLYDTVFALIAQNHHTGADNGFRPSMAQDLQDLLDQA